MKKEKKINNKEIINFSQSAILHIEKSIEKRGFGDGIRLGVKTTGCSGLAYVIEYIDLEDINQDEDEIATIASSSLKVVVDKKSLVYLAGCKLDFVTNGLNSGFEFSNPNAKGACGCGESFNV